MKPDITVAICTHDNADVLDRALRRLTRQRVYGARWELVVIDNRCSDHTPDVLRRWMDSGAFREMRVIREERLGLSHARRTAIAHARGDLIAFIDDDCFLHLGWIQRAVEFARRMPRAGAFGGRVRIRWETPPKETGVACEWLLARQELGGAPRKLPDVGGAPLVGAGIVIRREALEQSGWVERGHFTGRIGKVLTAGDDAEISFRVRSAGWQLWYTPAMVIDHVLGAWRSEPEYLERLHYGCGLTLPYIWILGGIYHRNVLSRIRFLWMGMRRAFKASLSSFVYRLRGKSLRSQLRRFEVKMYLGVMHGAFNLPEPEPVPRALPAPATQPAAGGRLAPTAPFAREL